MSVCVFKYTFQQLSFAALFPILQACSSGDDVMFNGNGTFTIRV